MVDARFEDADEGPLRLIARDPGEVAVVSSLLQDAVFHAADMRYDRKARRFALLVGRFRWEDKEAAARSGRPFERVRTLLVIEDVLRARRQGIDPQDKETVCSLLSLDFAAGEEGAGIVTLTLAGDGAVALDVEALDLRIEDVTRPYVAPSRKAPDHGV